MNFMPLSKRQGAQLAQAVERKPFPVLPVIIFAALLSGLILLAVLKEPIIAGGFAAVTLSAAAQRNIGPTVAVMNGQMMYSPEPTPRPARMTLGPSTLPSGSGSGISR